MKKFIFWMLLSSFILGSNLYSEPNPYNLIIDKALKKFAEYCEHYKSDEYPRFKELLTKQDLLKKYVNMITQALTILSKIQDHTVKIFDKNTLITIQKTQIKYNYPSWQCFISTNKPALKFSIEEKISSYSLDECNYLANFIIPVVITNFINQPIHIINTGIEQIAEESGINERIGIEILFELN